MKINGLLLSTLVALPLSACSLGSVKDADTNAKLGGALIQAQQLALTSSYSDPMSFTANSGRSVRTWAASMPGANDGVGYWYLNPYADPAPGDETKTFISPGWTRFEVSQPGYDSRAFFRDHQYSDCDAQTANPYSAGPYAYVKNGPTMDGKCAIQNFALRASNRNYAKDPDVIVDPRWLRDNSYVTVRGEHHDPTDYASAGTTCEGAANACIRVSVGTANIGVGDLWLTAPVGQQNQVTQHRFNRLSGMTDTQLSNAVFLQDDHPHLHLANWTQIRLRRMDATCSSDATATNCPILPNTGHKVSFCLMDLQAYDSSTNPTVYQPNKSYLDCGTVENGQITQGIGSGRMDIYHKLLAGQFVPADGLHGDFWLEVEVNPADAEGRRTVLESDYTNNVSRTHIKIP